MKTHRAYTNIVFVVHTTTTAATKSTTKYTHIVKLTTTTIMCVFFYIPTYTERKTNTKQIT